MGFYKIPDGYEKELEGFAQSIQDFESGKINPVKFKAIRVGFGCYEQRKDNTFMIRARCPGGAIEPKQLLICAELSRDLGGDVLHITTRQELQIHHVTLDKIIPILKELLTIGLVSRGGGGNTLRNLTASVDAGVSRDEAFDVSPYCCALTERLIAEPDSWDLPRKYKISFSGSEQDNSFATITDLGFIAKIKDGVKGFRVYVAGGMGKKSNIGNLLYDFVPAERVYYIAAALKKMFDKHGNRRKKYASRLRFLWQKLGRDEFVRLLEGELHVLEADKSLPLALHERENRDPAEVSIPVEHISSDEFEIWKKRYVSDQKQPGLKQVLIPVRHGNISYQAVQRLCYFLTNFGENVIRFSMNQNIHLRNIPEAYLGNAFDVVKEISRESSGPFVYANMVTCTGAATCKLGICLSRNLSDAIEERLLNSSLDHDRLQDVRMYISGCPNSCGQHPVGDIGFYGRASRNQGVIYPAYRVLAGGRIVDGNSRFAEEIAEVNSHDIPAFLEDCFREYLNKAGDFSSFSDYVEKSGKEDIAAIAAKYQHVPTLEEDPAYYVDWGAERRLSLEDIGTDQCSAGLFDMIEVDERQIKANLKAADEAKNASEVENALYQATLAASRMLLVTQGINLDDEKAIFSAFSEHFIDAGLVPAEYKEVIELGRNRDLKGLVAAKGKVSSLGDVVIKLYDGMDDSLRFTAVAAAQPAEVAENAAAKGADLFKDFRGVGCPMNFVKTKLVLETMASGQTLEVLLDDGAPIENVPRSVLSEGHKIVEQKAIEGYHSVLIQKVGPEPVVEARKADVFKDFRGVGCPMNFVKTKLVLEMMEKGKVLEILLDGGPPIENVPRSVLSEGHKILEQKEIDGHWSVVIEKVG